VKKYFYNDRKPAFSLAEEPDLFRLRMEQSEIEEHHVEEFLDKTVEWLSANSEKPMLIDFEGVRWVCSDFTAHLAEYCHDAKAKGFIVNFVNVSPTIQPYVDVQAITEQFTPRRSVLSISTKQVLEDIERNLSNRDLMDKYGLSLRGLASLFKKLLNKGLITRRYLEERSAREKGPIEIDLDAEDFLKTIVPRRAERHC
jgi:anti-anti-sigma regulatory factor